MTMQTSTTVKLDTAIKAKVQHLADIRKRSVHSLLVEAIENYVSREEQRESLRMEARAAHDDFIRTGLHITGDEADAWLAQLEAGHDAELPKCHI